MIFKFWKENIVAGAKSVGVFLFLPLFDFQVNLGWEEQELWIRCKGVNP